MPQQPPLRLFELARGVGRTTFPVELDQLGVPFTLEALGEKVDGFAVAAELQKAPGRGARDLRMPLRRIRQPR